MKTMLLMALDQVQIIEVKFDPIEASFTRKRNRESTNKTHLSLAYLG